MPKGPQFPLRMSFALTERMQAAIKAEAAADYASEGDVVREALTNDLPRRRERRRKRRKNARTTSRT